MSWYVLSLDIGKRDRLRACGFSLETSGGVEVYMSKDALAIVNSSVEIWTQYGSVMDKICRDLETDRKLAKRLE